MATRITKGKFGGLTAMADQRGVISAVAMDQRGSLAKAIAQARGGDQETTADDLTQFKIAVAEVLTKYGRSSPWWTVYGGKDNIDVAAARGAGGV